MATAQAANPIYHDPTPSQTRTRRSSSRRSFASPLSRTASHIDSPRAACPKDGDAFSYDPAQLRMWYVPQGIWDHLPVELRSCLAAVQHSGAAVLTGFARLDKHNEDNNDLVHLDHLPPPRFRTISNASSVFGSDSSTPHTDYSPASESGSTSPVTSSLSQSHAPVALSPMYLGSPADPFDKQTRSRDRSFSTPLDPHEAYYANELSHLRTEALPRLRHLGFKVDTQWYEAKRTAQLSAEDVNAFEKWWAEKTCTIVSLNEQGKRLATAHGLVPTGRGWCAP